MLNIFKFIFNPDWFTFSFGGGGGPTTTKSETSNIPEYARPYVERMLGSTEKQVYTYGDKGNITGFQPYKPFEGETVAGFTPMQRQAMQGIGSYQLPGQTGAATEMTGYASMGSMGAGSDYARQATDPGSMRAYMSPYMENALQPQMREAARQSAMQGRQNTSQAVQAGAFGGSRFGLQEAERQRNLAQQQEDIYGKGMQNAFQSAQQAQQFGAELGLKGYEGAMRGAGQLGALGQQQYGQEMGLLGQQMEIGGKQQQYEQARLNQIIQDYATAQQYPFIQLGTLSNMLRGLPMQASTTQMYQAQPPALQQAVGLAGAGANLYQAMKAEGGEIKEMASGGIATGVDPYKLPGMMKKLSDDQLKDKMGGDTDPETLGIAQAEKKRRDQVRGMAGGGAVAFKEGKSVKDEVGNSFDVNPKEEPKKEAPPVAARPKAAAPKPVAETSPYQADFKRVAATPNEGLTALKTLRDSYKTDADVGIEGQMERRQKLYDKYGVDPMAMYQNEKAEQQRALEEANGDAKKAEHLRWAQMFAKFGSTPGPVLKAALTAINDTVPDLLDDQTRARALQRSIKKTIYELDKAELMEKKGKLDEASKLDQDAKAKLASASLEFAKLQANEQEAKLRVSGQLAGEEMGARARIEAERIQAASRQSSDQRAEKENRRREDAQTVNAQKALENFEKNKARIDKQKDAERKVAALASKPDNPMYIQAVRDLEAIKAERQAYIANLPAMYPLARLGDLAGPDKQPEAPRNADSTLQPGQIVDGYKFKGGDPNDKNNWAKN
jgi:hypothetical protein